MRRTSSDKVFGALLWGAFITSIALWLIPKLWAAGLWFLVVMLPVASLIGLLAAMSEEDRRSSR